LKCCELKSAPQSLYPSIVFTFGLVVESIREVGGASHTLSRLTTHPYMWMILKVGVAMEDGWDLIGVLAMGY
jgi:hypothetical protein